MNIAIVDRYPIIRIGLSHFLKEKFLEATIIESDSISTLRDAHQDLDLDIIIMALSQDKFVDNMDTIALCKQWYDLKKVVVYDEETNFAQLPHYFKAGICNYLSKQADLKQMLDYIVEINDVEKLNIESFGSNQKYKETAGPDSLTTFSPREYQIAIHLSDGKRNKWIAQNMQTTAASISAYKRKIFKKVNADNIIQLREYMQFYVNYIQAKNNRN
jgi:DNA-binding NarL/FixJ family response regulator